LEWLNLVAGTGLEPVSAAADMSPKDYKSETNLFINSLPFPVFKSFSLFKASDLLVKNATYSTFQVLNLTVYPYLLNEL
jgi:hypothetical protein